MKEIQMTNDNPYRYSACGTKNICLIGISKFDCPECGDSFVNIPKIGELHKAITEVLIEKEGMLTGTEIRFLRKNAGFSGVKFATLMKIGPSHLSNAEHDRQKLSPTADKMVRLIAEAVISDKDFRELLLEVAEHINNRKKKQGGRKMFKHDGQTWQQMDLAIA
jgi:DNA-binding transcriptional regulator YiaG/predicted RNA-binding Zn-ribbon protein involved in translation (DUF1610 family)